MFRAKHLERRVFPLFTRRLFATLFDSGMYKLLQIPMFQDNYSFLMINKKHNEAFAIDPAEPSVVVDVIKKEGVQLTDVLTTHHHWDHAGGNKKLLQLYPKLRVYGGEDKIDGLNQKVTGGDAFECLGLNIEVISTPCHTAGHVVYFIPQLEPPVLFSGDTLFVGGCGRFFEGNAEQMKTALLSKLSKLPHETLVCCGHEYTLSNLEFAVKIEPDNAALQDKLSWSRNKRKENQSTVPSTIGEEKEYNPFMRLHSKSIQQSLQKLGYNIHTDTDIMHALRDLKNSQ